MDPLDLIGLSPIMAHTCGDPKIVIGLIDGPVAENHPHLTRQTLHRVPGRNSGCKDPDSGSCRHGTFIAGILNAKRSSPAPGICPACTLLIRPVFSEYDSDNGEMPGATPVELAWALIDCIDHGARIVNMSIALEEPSPEGDAKLTKALDYAAEKGVIVVAAAGNQGIIGASALTRHPRVVPVAACDLQGRFVRYSNRTGSICRNGVMAPGEKVTSLGSDGRCARIGGTSTAVPFVSGAIALLWSLFRELKAQEILFAVTGRLRGRTASVPPLLNAWESYESIRGVKTNGQTKSAKRKAA